MNIKRNQRLAVLGTVAAVVMAALSTTAPAASAAPALFNDTGTVSYELDGPLVLNYGPAGAQRRTLTCTSIDSWTGTTASNSATQGSIDIVQVQAPASACASTRGVNLYLRALNGTSTVSGRKLESTVAPAGMFGDSASLWVMQSTVVPYAGVWTNGTSSLNPSRVSFSSTVIGNAGGYPVQLTATFKVRLIGNLLTLA